MKDVSVEDKLFHHVPAVFCGMYGFNQITVHLIYLQEGHGGAVPNLLFQETLAQFPGRQGAPQKPRDALTLGKDWVEDEDRFRVDRAQ